MNELHFRTVLVHQQPSFMTDGVRHDDDHPVSFHGTHKSKPDALITGSGFYDHGALMQLPPGFRFIDHVQCDPGLDGTAYVQSFIFYEHTGTVFTDHPRGQFDHGSMPNGF